MSVIEEAPKPAVVFGGGGYRAVNTNAGTVEWSCRHVHFTDRSARNCAEQHLKATHAVGEATIGA